MKKNLLFIGLGIVLMAVSLYNLTLGIKNKGHYFGNGIICGIGLSIVVVQFLKLRKK